MRAMLRGSLNGYYDTMRGVNKQIKDEMLKGLYCMKTSKNIMNNCHMPSVYGTYLSSSFIKRNEPDHRSDGRSWAMANGTRICPRNC